VVASDGKAIIKRVSVARLRWISLGNLLFERVTWSNISFLLFSYIATK